MREYGALAAWDEEANVVVAAEEAQWKQATLRLAHRIVYGIDRVTAVTPTALAACALLATGRRGIVRRELLTQARFLMERARANRGRLSAALVDDRGELDIEALDRAIELLARDGDIEVRAGGGASGAFDVKSGRPLDEIYTVPEDRRPRLAYYRNNAIHLFVADGLVALALLAGGPARAGRRGGAAAADAQALAAAQARVQLSRRREPFEAIFDQTLAGLKAAGLVGTATHGVHPAPGAAPQLGLLGRAGDRLRRVVLRRRARRSRP